MAPTNKNIKIPIRLAKHLASGELNVQNVCRICFNEDVPNLVFMFEQCEPSIADMFTLFTSIQIRPNDNSSPKICRSCREQIIYCYEFKQQCESAEIVWKSILKNKFITEIKEESNISIYTTGNDAPSRDSLHNYENIKVERDQQHNVQEIDMSMIDENEGYLEIVEQYKEERIDDQDDLTQNFNDVDSDSAKDSYHLILKEEIEQQPSSYKCTFCSAEFLKSKNLKQHVSMVHKIKTTLYECKSCKQSFTSQGDLHIHSSVHDGNGLTCNQCAKIFISKNKLRRHLSRHMSDKKYKCGTCGKDFCEHSALARHRRIHTGEVIEKKYSCKVCDKRFTTGYALRVHRVQHSGEKLHVCAVCARTFASSRLLRSHMRIHDDHKPYCCHYCNKSFRHESVRTTHHRTHTGERPYVCAVCGKTFIQHSNLSIHMRVHTGEKSYECRICKRSFRAISTLTAHELTHSGEKPYECDVCGKRFARKNMASHLKRHTGERSHPCSVCPKKFITASALRDHFRLHTGEKPFECDICGQKFCTKTHLRTHIKSHNKQNKNPKKKIYQNKSKVTKKMDELNIAVESLGLSRFLGSEVDVDAIDCIGELELQTVDDNSRTEYIVLEPDQSAVKVTTFTHTPDMYL